MRTVGWHIKDSTRVCETRFFHLWVMQSSIPSALKAKDYFYCSASCWVLAEALWQESPGLH